MSVGLRSSEISQLLSARTPLVTDAHGDAPPDTEGAEMIIGGKTPDEMTIEEATEALQTYSLHPTLSNPSTRLDTWLRTGRRGRH